MEKFRRNWGLVLGIGIVSISLLVLGSAQANAEAPATFYKGKFGPPVIENPFFFVFVFAVPADVQLLAAGEDGHAIGFLQSHRPAHIVNHAVIQRNLFDRV